MFSKFFQAFLFILNLICFIFGLGIIGTGSDLLMTSHIYYDFIGLPIYINTTLIVVFGTLLVFLTFLGCFGITGSPNKGNIHKLRRLARGRGVRQMLMLLHKLM